MAEIADRILKRLNELKQMSVEFSQMVNAIEGTFESKETEIRALQLRVDKLKSDEDEANRRSNKILTDAGEQAASMTNTAKRLLSEAQQAQIDSRAIIEEAKVRKAEADSLMAQALEKQRTADAQWRSMEERKRKIEEAIR